MQAEEQVHDLLTVAGVEIAGGLVGEEDFRAGRQRPRYGDALLFAAGKLRREMVEPVAEANGLQRIGGLLDRVAPAQEFEWQGDVLQRGHGRHQVERLKDDADICAAGASKAVFSKRHEIVPGNPYAAAGGFFEPGHDHEQRRFAGPARSDDADGLIGAHGKIHPAQDFDGTGAAVKRKVNISKINYGFRHGRRAPMARTAAPLLYGPNNERLAHGDKVIWTSISLFATLGIILSGLTLPQAAHAASPDREIVIVALGDSLTAGYQLPPDAAFPVQLEKALRAKGLNVRVVNSGVSGDTAADALARFDWAMPEKADAAIVELGANDALQGIPVPATEKALNEILSRLKARHMDVLIAGMEAPRNWGEDYVKRFTAMYRSLQNVRRPALSVFPRRRGAGPEPQSE